MGLQRPSPPLRRRQAPTPTFTSFLLSNFIALKIKATTKYESNNYDKVLLRFPKGQREKIKTHAESMGESINSFVNRAINETMQRYINPLILKNPVNADLETERARKAILDKLHEL